MDRKGFRKKPEYIYWLGMMYFIAPFLTLYQFYLNVDRSTELLKQIIFSNFYLTEVFYSFTAGIAVLTVTKIGFFYFIGLGIYTLGKKAYNLYYNSIFEYPFDFVVLLFWFIVTSLFLFTALRIPYLNPKTRWWRQPPRYSHKMPGILIVDNTRIPITTLNFSKGGIFVLLDKDMAIDMGQAVDLEIDLIPEAKDFFKEGKFFTKATVVWCAKKDPSSRYGLGLQFIGQTLQEKRQLRRYARLLKRLHLHLGR